MRKVDGPDFKSLSLPLEEKLFNSLEVLPISLLRVNYMKWLVFIFSVSAFAQSNLGERCSTSLDPNILESIHEAGGPVCVLGSNSGEHNLAPFQYQNYTKAQIRTPVRRNATIDDFIAGEMIKFVDKEEVEQGYYWPYDVVFRESSSHYYFFQSGNENRRTEINISQEGPFKRIAISEKSYHLNIICADQSYFDTCVQNASVNTSSRSEIKDLEPTGSGASTHESTSSKQ